MKPTVPNIHSTLFAPAFSALSLLGACALTPPPQENACQDISGIAGRDYELVSKGGGGWLKTEVKASSKLKDVSREFLETVVKGNELCLAVERGTLDAKVYSDFLKAQVAGIAQVAYVAGLSPKEIDRLISERSSELERRAPARWGLDLNFSGIIYDAENDPLKLSPFQRAGEIFTAHEPQVPALAYLDLYREMHGELRALQEQLRDQPEHGARNEALSKEMETLRAKLSDLEARERPPIELLPANWETLGVVFFGWNSTSLDAQAERDIRAVVQEAGSAVTYRIEGFADPSGSFEYNSTLSRSRADAVAAYMRTLGVSSFVTSVGAGRTDRFGDNAAANRRVLIQLLYE